MSKSSAPDGVVKCPFCGAEFQLKYSEGVHWKTGDAILESEGRCSSCAAYIVVETTIPKGDELPETLVCGQIFPQPKKGEGSPGELLIFAPSQIKSYTIREGVRIP